MSGNVRRCFVPDCDARVPNDLLMCRDHWLQVPSAVQVEVYRTFNDMRAWPSRETRRAYVSATHHARDAVHERREL